MSAHDWAGIKGEYERHRHAAFPVKGGHEARNFNQRWLSRFDGRGFEIKPDGSGWSWGMELQSYGFEGRERTIEKNALVKTETGRVTYTWSDELDEWYVNDRRGLEHGFTLKSRPERGAGQSSPLRLRLKVRGGLRPHVQTDRRGVSFIDGSGMAALNYTGLKVWDGDGKELDARFSVEGEALRLSVDEAGARYPLTIDPLAQQAYLKAPNAEEEDEYGEAVAISGNTVVVGAVGEASNATVINGNQSNNSAEIAGAAYVYVRNGTTWSHQAYLKAFNTNAGDLFGVSVAISGETIVVGAVGEDSNATVVDGSASNNSASFAGAAYVFVRTGGLNGTWSQQAYLKASNTDANDYFGRSVSISGDTIVVSANEEDSNDSRVNGNQADNTALQSGAAYVFVRNGTTWAQQAYLKPIGGAQEDFFGQSVAISGETIVVGASAEDSDATGVYGDPYDNGAEDSGAAYVFVRTGGLNGTWEQQAYLKASNTGDDDGFGASVAISDETIVVGAAREDSSATGVDGDGDDDSAERSGAAYIFVRTGGLNGTWEQQAYLKASNTGADDNFGYSVGISGQRVVVGARRESSDGTGVNGGAEGNNGEDESGAAYLFVRDGESWIQQAYLKASNTEEGDQFGYAVAISGDTVVVGASGEDSSATVINGDETNNNANDSGAVYIFQTESNTPPTIAAASGITRQAGSPLSNSTIATVSDTESGAGGVTVKVNNGASATVMGVNLSNIVNTDGTITADLIASCSATTATFTLTATDESGSMQTASLTVTVNPNTAPTLIYNPQMVAFGQAVTISPATPANDNGTVTGYSLKSIMPAVPSGSVTVNGATGAVSVGSNVPVGNYTIVVTAADNCNLGGDGTLTLTVNCASLTLGALANGTAGTVYNQPLNPGGGTGPYTVMQSSGTLPPGLMLSGGSLSGTPTQAGTYDFTLNVTDTYQCSGGRSYSVKIECPTITLSPSSLPAATIGAAYTPVIAALPAGGNYTFEVTAGQLPDGIMLNSNGSFSGAPTLPGTFTFIVTATGFGNCTGSRSYTIVIPCPTITLMPSGLPTASVNTSYSSTITASPAGGNFTYLVTSGQLPGGVTLNPNGSFSGTVTQSGTFTFTVRATGFGGCTGSRSYTIVVGCPTITFDQSSLPGGTLGASYGAAVAASPAGSYSYMLQSGALPGGVTLDSSTGMIAGTPTSTGTFNFVVRATSGTCTGTRSYSITIACPTITLNPTTLPNGTRNVSYSQTITVAPAGGSYVYQVTSGSLPPGLSLTAMTGVLSGTPTVNGTYTFTIKATRLGTSCNGSRSYTVTVNNTGITTAIIK